MNKTNKEQQEQELKRLSKKYFWEQKLIEIFLFILIILGSFTALYISGSIMRMLNPEWSSIHILLCGWLGLFLFALISLFLFYLGSLIYFLLQEWIKSNKEKARRKAKEELGIKLDFEDF